jgi:hypothetical protein
MEMKLLLWGTSQYRFTVVTGHSLALQQHLPQVDSLNQPLARDER